MAAKVALPLGISLAVDIEERSGGAYRARVRWVDPAAKKRVSKSETFVSPGIPIDQHTLNSAAPGRLRAMEANGYSPAA